MKKSIAISSVVAALCLNACAPKPASIDVTPNVVTINDPADAPSLSAKVRDAKNQDIPNVYVTWTSSTPAVVDVDAKGKLSAKASGKATITATSGAVKKEVLVSVAIFKDLQVAETELGLKAGESKKLTITLANEKKEPIEDAKLIFESADPAVATVDEQGNVTGVANGTTQIVIKAKPLAAQLQVTVKAGGPASLKAEKTAIDVKVGKTATVAVSAVDAEGKPMPGLALTWGTSSDKTATVSPTGQIKGIAKGAATITASAGDKSVSIKVTVKK